jgi:hypothetical protein
MKIFKLFTITLFIIFSSLTSITYAESLKFDASTYEGEVKKGKANGVGIFTFSDGSTYEGKVKNNKIHGDGKYIDAQGKVYEGKFKYGSFKTKIDKKTREVIKLKPKTGFEAGAEIKGTGTVSTKWFAAEKNSSGVYEMTAKGKSEMAAAISAGAGDGGSSGSSGSSGGC